MFPVKFMPLILGEIVRKGCLVASLKEVSPKGGRFMDVGEVAGHLRKYEKKLMYH
jgi:hypothetical protein